MIKHRVLFKLKEFSSQEEKTLKINEIKSGLEALIDIIPQLKKIFVGVNINPKEGFDICLETEHDTLEDLNAYATHPDHLAVSKIIREVLDSRACVDYEV
ncbi:stress responsive protein [Bacteroidia bacterium]|nr:stress responsive protein [Bacteroidia bacterium]